MKLYKLVTSGLVMVFVLSTAWLPVAAAPAASPAAAGGTRQISSGGTTSPFISGVQFGVADECRANDGSAFSVPGISPPAGCNGNLGRNRFVGPGFFQFDLRLSKDIPFGERFKLQLIADSFNLFNRTNVAALNQVCDPSAGSTCLAGQPTAAYDARQFQFALKLFW